MAPFLLIMKVNRNIFRIYPFGDAIFLSPIKGLNDKKELQEIKSGSWVEIRNDKIYEVARF